MWLLWGYEVAMWLLCGCYGVMWYLQVVFQLPVLGSTPEQDSKPSPSDPLPPHTVPGISHIPSTLSLKNLVSNYLLMLLFMIYHG